MISSLQVAPNEEQPLSELVHKATEVTTEEKYLDRDNFIRVLRARELNPQQAFEMWQKWYDWRVTYRADSITEAEMEPQIATGKIFIHGTDNKNRPCLIVRTRNHWPGQFSREETMRFIIYNVEKIIKIADETGVGKICVIWDRAGVTQANRDNQLIELIRSLATMLQDFYAERLAAIYVLHVNWLYWLMFQVAKPLINRKTREKTHIVRNLGGLKEFFDASNLMEEYGGEDRYVHPFPRKE